ncbi:probable disease resistance protein At4g27220 [Amaranthus tricolor]|uniref:probable disease resistance protein At4g27220 n=1 Tax=Amaranthus tricolor TaxID=29722 RepID=UPI00258D5E00|nr:probable disease resistance protein At4g27220 [Amaranthus tricolor]XP_057540355.1 probable disease resistance protein At4g27220 [Amaranthus tricolor]
MDSLVSIITEVGGWFVEPVKNRAKLITDHKTFVDDLRDEHTVLSGMITRVQNKVKQAKNNGESIIDDVNKWFQEAQVINDDVASWLTDVGGLKPKCGPFPKCYDLYKRSKKAVREKKKVTSLVQRGNNIQEVSYPSSPKGIELVSHEGFTAFDSTTMSFNETLSALGKSSTKTIGVFGMGGIGKTTLVTEVGKVAKARKMFDQVVFAVVSQTLDIRKIQGQLGDMLGLTFSRETEIGRAGQLKDRLKFENTVLVILDDVWNTIDLGDIGIPIGNDHKGCKVLITTRREHVCTSMRCQEIVSLSLLDETEAWELFKINAGGVLNEPSVELKQIAKQVIGECQRLPLALVVVASALSGKSLDEWKTAAENLQKSKLTDIETVDRNVYACFRLSYDYLKAEATKKCFLLCSLFPEDHEIDIEELTKYAMGFGLFQDVDSFRSVKSHVQNTIKDLKASSLLLKTDNMANHVKMHDMVRDAALWITNSEGEKPFIVPTPLENNWVRNNKLGEAMAISLLAFPMNDRFPTRLQCPSLKLLLLAQRAPLRLNDIFFDGLKALQVLDLTAAKNRLEMVLPSSLKSLQNLRTLLLRRWKLKGDISMIGSLRSLEILSFSGSLIFELPMELAELSELRHLDLSGCKELAGSYTEVQSRLFKLEVVYAPNQPMLAFPDDDDEDEE